MASPSYFSICILLVIFWATGFSQSVTIPKCCFSNEVVDISVMKCRPSGENTWIPTFYSDAQDSTKVDGISYEIKEKSSPKCPKTGVHVFPLRDLNQISAPSVEFRLLSSGQVVAKHKLGHWVNVPPPYCVDGIQNFDDTGLYTGEEINQVIITCPLKTDD